MKSTVKSVDYSKIEIERFSKKDMNNIKFLKTPIMHGFVVTSTDTIYLCITENSGYTQTIIKNMIMHETLHLVLFNEINSEASDKLDNLCYRSDCEVHNYDYYSHFWKDKDFKAKVGLELGTALDNVHSLLFDDLCYESALKNDPTLNPKFLREMAKRDPL